MAEEFEEKLLQRLAQIKIAIESTNPDPQQSIQAIASSVMLSNAQPINSSSPLDSSSG